VSDIQRQRDVAAWTIRQGRALLNTNVERSDVTSRSDNNWTFEAGFHLIAIGRRIAMGYQFEQFTDEMYKAQVRATRRNLG